MAFPDVLGPFEAVQPDQADGRPAPPAGDAEPNPLPFSMQAQEGGAASSWCWAATTASVAQFYNAGSEWTQCLIATKSLGSQCCPGPPASGSDCDKELALEVPLQVTGNLAGAPILSALAFPDIVNEITNGRPVCCHIAWDPDHGHYNVIVGYDSDKGDVDVRDPLYGDSTLPYDEFAKRYHGDGVWDRTYLTAQ